MNVLYIHSHDTGRYIQPYGHAIPTPYLQRLAEEGVLFRQAFCAGPTCSPSRAALLTGQSPHSCGMTGLAHRGFSLADPSQHLASFLARAGYETVLAGVQHEAVHSPEAIAGLGYTRHLGRPDPELTAAAYLESKPAGPFFLAVGFGNTHRAYPEPDPDLLPAFCAPPDPLPDAPAIRRDMAALKTTARQLDFKIGTVLAALARSGLDRSTLVIATTDHGIAFPLMKCNLTDSGTGVMLILRGPREGAHAGLVKPGRAEDALVSQIDLFPTLCELLDLPKPGWLQGESLVPLLGGESASVRDAVFTEVNYHAAYEPMRAVRTARWKYIRRWEERRSPVLPNCDDSPSKTWLLENGWRDRAPDRESLFDLVQDPHEACNLAGQPGAAAVLGEMRQRLERWMQETRDPLLAGSVPAPTGAKVNDPDGISPNDPPRIIA
jgi:arylsulfatase A-like enzyme